MITVAELCAWGLPSILDPAADGGGRSPDPQRPGAGGGGRARAAAAGRAHPRSAGATPSASCSATAARREAMAARALARGRPARRARDSVEFIDADRLSPALSELAAITYISASIMDLFTPADRRPVHFVGIGGAGMSALALIACRRGVAVSGCDTDPAGRRRSRGHGRARSGRGTTPRIWTAPAPWSSPPRCRPTIPSWSGPGRWACRWCRGRKRWPS